MVEDLLPCMHEANIYIRDYVHVCYYMHEEASRTLNNGSKEETFVTLTMVRLAYFEIYEAYHFVISE